MAERNARVVKSYTEDGFSLTECGELYGVSRERIRQILVKSGVSERHHCGVKERAIREAFAAKKKRHRERVAKKREFSQAKRMEMRAFYDAGMNYADIARRFDCSEAYVQDAIVRTGGVSRRRWLTVAQRDEVKRRAKDETAEALAAEFGVTIFAIYRIKYAHEFGVGREQINFAARSA
jgi:predicted DNA-binding protein YlxM (UPF0122 family)